MWTSALRGWNSTVKHRAYEEVGSEDLLLGQDSVDTCYVELVKLMDNHYSLPLTRN